MSPVPAPPEFQLEGAAEASVRQGHPARPVHRVRRVRQGHR